MPKQLIVKGHALRDEGRVWRFGRPANSEGQTRCSCGQVSPILPTTAARKRWHRAHKESIALSRCVAAAGAEEGREQ